MAKLTRKQLNDWNAKLSNGWKFDTFYFLTWGEKHIMKDIDTGDGKFLRATLSFHELPGVNRWVPSGKFQPRMNLSIHTPIPTDENSNFTMSSSSGLGAYINVTDAVYEKRLFNELAKLTVVLDDARIMTYAADHSVVAAMNNPFVM